MEIKNWPVAKQRILTLLYRALFCWWLILIFVDTTLRTNSFNRSFYPNFVLNKPEMESLESCRRLNIRGLYRSMVQ